MNRLNFAQRTIKSVWPLKTIFLLLVATLLSACDSHEEPEPISNLVITDIQANTLAVYEHEDVLRVDYQLEVSELDSPDVAIDFYLVHKSDVAEGEEIDGVHLIQSESLLEVENGTTVGTFSVEIPVVAESGEYWIHSILDPNNDVIEDNEIDNYPNEESGHFTEHSSPTVAINIDAPPQHEFIFVDSSVSDDAVVLDSPRIAVQAGSEHHDIIGNIDAIYYGDSEVHAALSAQVMIDGTYQDVEIWDSTTQTYTDSVSIDFGYSGDEHDFGYDLRLSIEQIEALYNAYDPDADDNEINLNFTLTNLDEDNDEHDDSNNHSELTAHLYFYDGAQIEEDEADVTGSKFATVGTQEFTIGDVLNSIDFDDTEYDSAQFIGDYNLSYGDSDKVGLDLELYSQLQIGFDDYYGKIEASGDLSLSILGNTAEIIDADFLAQAYLAGEDTGYEAELQIFTVTVYEKSNWASDHFSKTFEKSWEEDKQIISTTFTLGPIPVTVKAGIDGSIGFGLTLGYDNVDAEIFADGEVLSVGFEAWATGGVNGFVAEAGVGVSVTILSNTLGFESAATIDTLIDENPSIDYSFDLYDEMEALSGEFYIYASYESVKYCNYYVTSVPCGTKTYEYEKNIGSWSGYTKNWDIYSTEGTIEF